MKIKRERSFFRLFFGIGLFLFSLIYLAATKNYRFPLSTTLPFVLSWIGIVYVIDWLDRFLIGKGLAEDLAGHVKHRFWRIAAVAIPFGLIIESYGVYFLRLWYYPYWSLLAYTIAAPFAFIGYTYILFGLYDFIKNLVHKPHIKGRWHIWQQWIYPKFMWLQGVFGMICLVSATLYIYERAKTLSIPIFDLTRDTGMPVVWWFPFTISFGVICTFEFIAYLQSKETLGKDIIRGYFTPIIAVTGANIFAIIAIEFFNGPFRIWRFANWAGNDFQILNMPILAVIVWPLQFYALLAMLRVAFTEKQVRIW